MAETPEMVERVARAISWTGFATPWAVRRARAAINAMRVPNEAMRYAVWHDQYVTCGGEPHLADALARKRVADPVQREQDLSSFSACIDAALASPEEGRD